MERTRVFGIGFHKTGTTSLAAALRLLGYRTVHGDPTRKAHPGDEGRSLIERIERGDYDLPTLREYDAFTDNPYFTIWRQLAETQREAKFILTLRDRDEWIESCVRYFAGRRIRPMRRWMFGDHADPSAGAPARAAWLARYDEHNRSVRDYFSDRPDRLLVMNIRTGDGWDVLCPFLGLIAPTRPFPRKKIRRA